MIVFQDKFRALSTHIKKLEIFHINYLMMHLKALKKKQEEIIPKQNSCEEIFKSTTEITKIETITNNQKTVPRINETKSYFFKKNQQEQQTFSKINQKKERF